MPVLAKGLHKAKKTKKQRKFGRNAASCLSYKNSNRRERNKIVHLRKHLSRFAGDRCATAAVDRCKAVLGMK
jgi:hypothetical protein